MNKYAIYTEGDVYPVLEKDGEYYIGAPGTGHFSGQWKFLGVVERLKNSRNIIKPEDALKITDWKFKNGSPKYQVVDLDHGTVRRWASPRQVISFGPISDNMFSVATKTDNDEEITLEESKKYNIYATYGGDGVYNSKLVDTVDSEEQAVDRVAELQATGVGASYEEVENDKKEESKHSKIADKIYDEYSEFIQGVYADNKNLNEFVSNMREDEGFLDYLNDYYDITSEKDIDLICRELYNIQVDIMNSLNEECSQASGVASGVNGKIDSFSINPKEMEKQRLKESTETQMIINIESGLNADGFDIIIKERDNELFEKSYSYGYDASYSREHADSARYNHEQAIKYNWKYADLYYNLKPYTQDIIEDLMKKYHITKNNIIVTNGKNVFKGEPVSDNDVNKFINKYIEPIKESKSINETSKESTDNPYFVIEDNGSCYLLAGPFNNEQEARKVKNSLIKKYNLEDEADIIYVWNWNRIKEYTYDAYDTYKEFIDGCDRAPYYKEEKLEESKEDDIFDAREELIDYLNKNTKYEWDANESYDNCAITESETDYIEVFVDIKDGNKIYTVDNYSYNSLEELVKNMPVLFTNEDEDYDYDSNWEDLDESKNDKNLDWIYDENEKLYHCEIDNWYFNIYKLEDGTYNLIVDYDEDELQDLDDIFDTLEKAKKKAQEIYNKGVSKYNGNDFAGFEYETESKDLTKTLQEMALLEDYEEDKTISPQKQKFIDYCKDKIEDLGDVEIYDEDYEENIQYHKLMHTEGIREFEDLYIVADFDNYENENLIAINNENKIVINTPMIDCNGYAATMQFDKIDKKFYDQLMDYWDDIYMDEMIEEE